MASKKKKYNARFPAGRIKRIMQTDEEVGKVAKAVPVIISRTLELFVESLLKKSMSVTLSRNAKTLSPSHVKQCIMAESRFDFLKDLVKNIPDVSAAEEKELQSAENSPTAIRFPEDKCETQPTAQIESILNNTTSKLYAKRPVSEVHSEPIVPMKQTKIETVTCAAIDLSIRPEPQRRVPNFYQETLNMDDSPTVIQANPNFSTPQPSTSFKMIPHLKRIDPLKIPAFQSAMTGKTTEPLKSHRPDLTITPPCLNRLGNNYPKAPITPVLNIDFTKNIESPEFKYSMPKKKEVKRTNLEKSASFESYTSTSKNLSKKPISKTPQLISRPQLDRMAAISSLDEDYDT